MAIRYRYLTVDCEKENKLGVEEGYSKNGIIKRKSMAGYKC